MDWMRYAEDFTLSSGLIDIVMIDTSINDWINYMSTVQEIAKDIRILRGNNQIDLPSNIDHLFPENNSELCTMDFYFEDIYFRTYFNTIFEIEMDFDSNFLKNETNFMGLVHFIEILCRTVNRPLILAWEGLRDQPILVMQPGSKLDS